MTIRTKGDASDPTGVAGQGWDGRRTAQEALGWDVQAWIEGKELVLAIMEGDQPVVPTIQKAIFGSATHVGNDQTPDFHVQDGLLRAFVEAGPGNWNLRLTALADDGTVFEQRIVVATR